MKVTILGNNSALPAFGRFPTSQIVEQNNQLMLVDCGEGAQMRMQEFEIKKSNINHVFISHIHGDHYLGLVGFISSLSLMGRERDLHIYCPKEIRKIVKLQLPWELGFQVFYHVIEEGTRTVLLDNNNITVECFPVYHSVPTHGFKFIEKKRKRVLLPEKVRDFEIPKYFYSKLTEGEDYEGKDGEIVKNEWVTQDGIQPKIYSYCADSRYAPEIIKDINGSDLMYFESTYLHDQLDKALKRLHCTAQQAGQLAKEAEVGKLIIGHFSSKYKDLTPLLEEARIQFENTELALEGKEFEV